MQGQEVRHRIGGAQKAARPSCHAILGIIIAFAILICMQQQIWKMMLPTTAGNRRPVRNREPTPAETIRGEHFSGRVGSKKILLFWVKKILLMTIPLDSSGLIFRAGLRPGPGLGRRHILQCKTTKNSISGCARVKKFVCGLQDLYPRMASKFRGRARPGLKMLSYRNNATDALPS
jgi:hypothetical protein